MRALAEAHTLRFGDDFQPGPGIPPESAGPPEVLAALRDVRGRLDRVEAIWAGLFRARSITVRASKAATAQAEDAWDQHAVTARSERHTESDYSTARERAAESNLATLLQRREARLRLAEATELEDAAKLVDQYRRGLDSLRQDLAAVLRAYSFQTSLES